jgi:hypothetical protein
VSSYELDDRVIEVRSPAETKDFFPLSSVSSGSAAHPAACLMGTGVRFPGGKARQGSDADHWPHLMPRSWMSRSYTSSHPCASISVLWDCFTFTVVYSTLCNDNYTLKFQNFRWIFTELGVNVIPLSPSKLLLSKIPLQYYQHGSRAYMVGGNDTTPLQKCWITFWNVVRQSLQIDVTLLWYLFIKCKEATWRPQEIYI